MAEASRCSAKRSVWASASVRGLSSPASGPLAARQRLHRTLHLGLTLEKAIECPLGAFIAEIPADCSLQLVDSHGRRATSACSG